MQILNQLETEPIPLEEEERNHTRRLLIGLACALLLTGVVLAGYLALRKRHERQVAAAAAAEKSRKAAPKIEVFVDDATLDGKKTVLGGTIHNISNEQFRNLSVQLQLRKRVGGGIETRSVTPQQTDLEPDGKTRYSVELWAQDYMTAQLLRIVSGDNQTEVPFRTLPGASRPPMEAPSPKTIVMKRPAPKAGEFINTPNNPSRVP
jgi:hypothetical protein